MFSAAFLSVIVLTFQLFKIWSWLVHIPYWFQTVAAPMESTADNYHEVQRVFLSKFVKPDLRNILY
jgi:hypothetical protein